MQDVEIPEVPVTEYVLRLADTHPDRPALIDGPSGRTYTYAELRDLIHRFADLSARHQRRHVGIQLRIVG